MIFKPSVTRPEEVLRFRFGVPLLAFAIAGSAFSFQEAPIAPPEPVADSPAADVPADPPSLDDLLDIEGDAEWANGIPSWPPAKSQQSPPKLAPRLASLARCSPHRPAEQANGTTADSESRRSPRERSRYKYRPVTDQFNFSEPGPNVAVHRAAHTVGGGFARPS